MIDLIVYAIIGVMTAFTALVVCRYKDVQEYDIPLIIAFSAIGWPILIPIAIFVVLFKTLDKLATKIANNLKARK